MSTKADEATKTRFRGHGANVTREEQDCLKVETGFEVFSIFDSHEVEIFEIFLNFDSSRSTSWEIQ